MNVSELKNKNLQVQQTQQQQVTVGMTDLNGFELAQRAAKLLAASTMVPAEYRGNIANCVVALNMAQRMGADVLMVMQNLYMVHGKPGWSAQFLISTFNMSNRFSALRYEFFGDKNKDDYGCRAWSVERETGDRLTGADVTIALAKYEGWYSKNGSKWKTMPQQMLMYRAASWFIRAYAPELSMGLHTTDELQDVSIANSIDSSHSVSVADLKGSASEGNAEDAVIVDDAPQWPQQITDNDTGEITWVDSAGEFFNDSIHSMSADGVPSIKKDGTFRAKRGQAQQDNEPPLESYSQ